MDNKVFGNIAFLVKNMGLNVAVITIGGEREYLLYDSFAPSQSGGSSTIDFCEFKGIIITEFLMSQNVEMSANSSFKSVLQSYIEREQEVSIKINKHMDYMLFSPK